MVKGTEIEITLVCVQDFFTKQQEKKKQKKQIKKRNKLNKLQFIITHFLLQSLIMSSSYGKVRARVCNSNTYGLNDQDTQEITVIPFLICTTGICQTDLMVPFKICKLFVM